MSTSPTKGEGTLPTPSAPRTGPPVNRRGHAHRRSGAISSQDLSKLLKPSSEPRGGSAPTTPSVSTTQNPFAPDIERSSSQPVPTLSKRESSIPVNHRASASFEGQPRPRVGFSDNLEFIPRPLSTISSETSSSLSTIRPNHSLTGSITSIVSAGTSSPPSAKVASSALDTMFEVDQLQPRPKTASPTIHGVEQRVTCQENKPPFRLPSALSMADSNGGESKTSQPGRNTIRSRSQDELSSFPPPLAPNIVPIDALSAIESWQPLPTSQPTPMATRHRTPPEPKRSKRQRKVKSWAGLILTRRARQRDNKEKREARRSPTPPTPPLRQFAPASEMRFEDVNFDEDTSCVVTTPYVHDAATLRTEVPSVKPHDSSPALDPDTSISMFDLDAALGSDVNDATAGGFLIPRRRMHSSVPKGDWQNMYYHRRTESAPEMMAPNPFSFPRTRSNPAMADVFEEEEEEEDGFSGKEDAVTSNPGEFRDSNSLPGLAVKVVDSATTGADATKRPTARPINLSEKAGNAKQDQIASCPRSEDLADDIEIVGPDEEPRASVVTKSSDESTMTVTLPNDLYVRRPVSAPIDFAMSRSPNILLAPETTSSISSPDCTRTSFDGSRMHTANSSMTDRATLSSLRTGEHAFSMRGSVDDVPSLISSPSTTIISACPPRFSSSAGTRSSGDHSSALPTPVPRRTRQHASKRSSLGNLSRLIVGSHGEKSKLSIEEHAEPDKPEKMQRNKGNRIGRLMRFWK